MSQFVAPSGYIDLDNDCGFSIDLKSTRSRESINPKEDLAFYFNTYIVPKYGLDNINVNNVASFMKDLDMNWSKLTSDLKIKVMDIMVDGILNKDSQFKNDFMKKLNLQPIPVVAPNVSSSVSSSVSSVSSFGKFSKSSFGNNSKLMIVIAIVIVILGYFYLKKGKKVVSFGRLS